MPVYLGTDPTGVIEYRILSKDRLEEALAVQQLSMHHECIAIGVGMYEDPGAAEEMKLVFREVVKDGCTVIAVDQSDRVVAVAFNKLCANIQAEECSGNKPMVIIFTGDLVCFQAPSKPGETDPLDVFVENNIKHRPCRDLIDFLSDVESRVDIFQKYNARGAMEIFYIGTDPRYRGRGIGLQITDMSLKLARGLRARKLKQICIGNEIVNEHVRPEVVFAAVASAFSQRITEKLNFEALYEVRYEDYVRGGKRMSDRIGPDNQTVKLVARKL